MLRFERDFGGDPVIIPVLSFNRSFESINQALENAKLVYATGLKGLMIHDGNYDWLSRENSIRDLLTEIHTKYPDFWLAINLPEYRPGIFQSSFNGLNGIFIENIRTSDYPTLEEMEKGFTQEVKEFREITNWGGQIIAGVNFREEAINGLHIGASVVNSSIDVIATGGERTGLPPTEDKIKSLKELFPDKPIAISGVSPQNIEFYRERGVKMFVVRSSLREADSEAFSPQRLRDFNLIKRHF